MVNEPTTLRTRAGQLAARLNHASHTHYFTSESKPTTLDSDVTATSRWEGIFTRQREHQQVDVMKRQSLGYVLRRLDRQTRHALRPERSEPGPRQGARSMHSFRRESWRASYGDSNATNWGPGSASRHHAYTQYSAE